MAPTLRAQPYRLDPPHNAEEMAQLITNADEMFQRLFEDLKAVNDAVKELEDAVTAQLLMGG